jgi:hypothetical protein
MFNLNMFMQTIKLLKTIILYNNNNFFYNKFNLFLFLYKLLL